MCGSAVGVEKLDLSGSQDTEVNGGFDSDPSML